MRELRGIRGAAMVIVVRMPANDVDKVEWAMWLGVKAMEDQFDDPGFLTENKPRA